MSFELGLSLRLTKNLKTALGGPEGVPNSFEGSLSPFLGAKAPLGLALERQKEREIDQKV